jgi:quinol monooxygenase YgiN
MIIVAGTLRVAPDRMEALRPHAEAVIAKTRQEPGCITYSFAEDLVEQGLVRIFELWRSRDDLDAHGRAPHMSEWRAALAEIGVLSRDLQRYETADGTPI